MAKVAGAGMVQGSTPAESSGGSILGLMMLGAAKGDTIDIAVTSEGAAEEVQLALARIAGLVKDGFGEDLKVTVKLPSVTVAVAFLPSYNDARQISRQFNEATFLTI